MESRPGYSDGLPSFGNTFTPEPSLGNDVTSVVGKGISAKDGELFFPLGKVGSASYSVEIQLSQGGLGLTEASMIARDCFTHM